MPKEKGLPLSDEWSKGAQEQRKTKKRGKKTAKKEKITLEESPTVKEIGAPTVLEEPREEVEEEVRPEDILEIVEKDQPVEDEELAKAIANIRQQMDEQTRMTADEAFESLKGKEPIIDAEFDEEFDKAWNNLDVQAKKTADLKRGIVNEKEVDVLARVASKITDELPKPKVEKIQLPIKELKVWDVEQGQKRVEAFGRGARNFFEKGKGRFVGLAVSGIGEGLKSFGRIARNLSYGGVGAMENLPQVIAENIHKGVTGGAEKGFNLLKNFIERIGQDLSLAELEIKARYETKQKYKARAKEVEIEQKERKEYARLKAQFDRFEELRRKFEII